MNDHPTFRAWLKQLRHERGLTQEQLGELTGYAEQTIRKIEGGQRRPSSQLALRLADLLQVAPEERAAWMAAARAASEPDRVVSAPGEPPRAAPTPHLPTYLTPFVGRKREQDELAALLGRPDCRLVTLLGPGGVGKTRLAVETARIAAGFADGVAFVSLAPYLGLAALQQQAGDEAIYFFRETLPLLRATSQLEVAQTLNDLAAALSLVGAHSEAKSSYREALATALEIKALPDALRALAGLASSFARDGQHHTALALAQRVLADPASTTETRHLAAAAQQMARSHLSPPEVARAASYDPARPLAAILADLDTPVP